MQEAYRLNGKPIAVTKDYPYETSKVRQALWPEYKKARSDAQTRVQIKYPARLVVNGYTIKDYFPDWYEVMKKRQAYTGRESPVDSSDTEDEECFDSPRHNEMVH